MNNIKNKTINQRIMLMPILLNQQDKHNNLVPIASVVNTFQFFFFFSFSKLKGFFIYLHFYFLFGNFILLIRFFTSSFGYS